MSVEYRSRNLRHCAPLNLAWSLSKRSGRAATNEKHQKGFREKKKENRIDVISCVSIKFRLGATKYGTSREVGPDDDDDDDDFNLRRYFRGTKRGFDGDKSIGTADPRVRRRCAATGRGDNPLSAQN